MISLRTIRRPHIVWASFTAAMTLVTGILILGDGGAPRGFVATTPSLIATHESTSDPISPRESALDRDRWTSIVIHHSGSPAGSAETLHRQFQSLGYDGLGYHFLIGNGQGLGDGVVDVGYRWNRQLPGAHVVGTQSEHYNQHAIGICLIGNGDRRAFTERQVNELIELVRRLQRELRIPAEQVRFHHELASVSGPGRFFPAAEFRLRLSK
jgi:N-acetyl-anhydromuramyl-L-alanine amidase AmpD